MIQLVDYFYSELWSVILILDNPVIEILPVALTPYNPGALGNTLR